MNNVEQLLNKYRLKGPSPMLRDAVLRGAEFSKAVPGGNVRPARSAWGWVEWLLPGRFLKGALAGAWLLVAVLRLLTPAGEGELVPSQSYAQEREELRLLMEERKLFSQHDGDFYE